MANICKNVVRILGSSVQSTVSQIGYLPLYLQCRMKSLHHPFFGNKNFWPKYSMMKNQRRRMILKEYGAYKVRYTAIRRAELLPVELRDIVLRELKHEVPLDAVIPHHLNRRCALTSRGKGTVIRWNLNRMTFRHLADNNKLAGVQRAIW